MSTRNVGEQAAIASHQVAAEITSTIAEDLRIAAAATRLMAELTGEHSLARLERNSGVNGLDLDRLMQAGATTDRVADGEESIAAGLARGADSIQEHGLPR